MHRSNNGLFKYRMLEKWGLWQSYLPLKCSLSVHFNEITTQLSKLWKAWRFYVDSDEKSQINLQNIVFFSDHASPTAWFLQRLSLLYKETWEGTKNIYISHSVSSVHRLNYNVLLNVNLRSKTSYFWHEGKISKQC